MKQETIEEVAERLYPYEVGYGVFDRNCKIDIERERFVEGAKWQQERSQKIVPFDAVDIEVFAIKPDEDGKLFAYIGYKIANGNFEFNVVPFTEPQAERMYSDEEKELMIKIFHSYWFENNHEHEDNLKEWELSKKLFEQFKKK